MPLPEEISFDTESGICQDGKIRNVLIQYCSINATSLEDVVILQGEDCYEQFLDKFEHTLHDVKLYFYNANWEARPFINHLIKKGYVYTEQLKGRGFPSHWTVLEDPMKVYSMEVRNRYDFRLVIHDDLLQVVTSMENASKLVRKEYPDWFRCLGEDTKLHIPQSLYNTWYTLPESHPDRELFLEYSRVDAFSQAMISRWLSERGRHVALTGASNGMRSALDIVYHKQNHWGNVKYFQKVHPPLDREMQDIVEDSVEGGFVHGATGHHYGKFCHGDYSSSYPYEYAYGNLFIGEVFRLKPDHPEFKDFLEEDNDHGCFRWMRVSFDFELKEGYMPAISRTLTRNPVYVGSGSGNDKMRVGHIFSKLFTVSYLNELCEHYNIENLVIEEIWVAKKRKGEFINFIEKCYNEKSRPELKGTMERDVWKRDMNAGVHGKTITKTHRKKCVYHTGDKETVREDTEPVYCSLIGFTAMMNARERLLRHCRMLIEAGHHIMMCDTDSIIADCSEAEFREAIGDWFMKGIGFDDIGRFDMETDDTGCTEFEELKCWGLKRYCEIKWLDSSTLYDFIQNNGYLKQRKTAFAGMHDETQATLINQPVDYEKYIRWHQKTKHWNGECFELIDQEKKARAENIYGDE